MYFKWEIKSPTSLESRAKKLCFLPKTSNCAYPSPYVKIKGEIRVVTASYHVLLFPHILNVRKCNVPWYRTLDKEGRLTFFCHLLKNIFKNSLLQLPIISISAPKKKNNEERPQCIFNG